MARTNEAIKFVGTGRPTQIIIPVTVPSFKDNADENIKSWIKIFETNYREI